MPESRNPSLAWSAVLALVLLSAMYFGAYWASLYRIPVVASGRVMWTVIYRDWPDRTYSHRWRGFFAPACWLDRRLFPARWGPPH
jgi:hypothetical protein